MRQYMCIYIYMCICAYIYVYSKRFIQKPCKPGTSLAQTAYSSFCVLMERTCKHSLSHVLVFDHMNLNGSVDISASSGSTPCRCKYHWDTVRKKTRKPI